MRTNNVPVSILATALAAGQLQAFIVPSVAMAWDQSTLDASVKVTRTITANASTTGSYNGTKVRVDLTAEAVEECGQFWVVDNFMTDDLQRQGFRLVLAGSEAPESLDKSVASVVPTDPMISENGKTLGFTAKSLAKGQMAGISYYLVSENYTVFGDQNKSLTEWIQEKTGASVSGSFDHLGTITKTVSVPTNPALTTLAQQGDSTASGTLKVTFNTNGGSVVNEVTIEKRLANGLMSQVSTPEREGYTFDGWFFDEKLTEAYDVKKIPSTDFTLYAKWVVAEATQTDTVQQTETTPAQQTQPTATNQQQQGTATQTQNRQTSKGDLVHTGADQTAAVIVASASVVAGLSVIVLKRLQK